MIKFILYILAGISIWMLCSSCSASKNIEEKTVIDYSESLNRLQSSIESLQVDIFKQRRETAERISNLKVENKTVYLSVPDSTGKQHPVRISETTAQKDEHEQTKMTEEVSFLLERAQEQLNVLNNKVDSLINRKQKVLELSWWDLHKDAVYSALMIFTFVIGYFVRRKL